MYCRKCPVSLMYVGCCLAKTLRWNSTQRARFSIAVLILEIIYRYGQSALFVLILAKVFPGLTPLLVIHSSSSSPIFSLKFHFLAYSTTLALFLSLGSSVSSLNMLMSSI